MQNFDNIKDLWQAAKPAELPDAAAIRAEAQKARRKMLRRSIIGGSILTGTFAFIVWIGLHYDFAYRTTPAGILLTLIAIIMGILFNSRLIQLLLKQGNTSLDNAAYLQELIRFRNTQRRIYTRGMSLYYLVLTLGIVLYMMEFARRSLLFGLISYSLTLAWIAFNWFYTRKRAIAKQEKVMNAQIEGLEKLVKGLKEEFKV